MSQTNEFAKAISPDFVYFDLQNTNIHNNDTGLAPQLQFLESRDAPIVDNAGEYTMSVTRFSVDTGNLPVLVVEPDITGTDPFDPHRTIHKVAIITEAVNLPINASGAVSNSRRFTEVAGSPLTNFGWAVATSADGEVIVWGEPDSNYSAVIPPTFDSYGPEIDAGGILTATGRGNVYIGIRNAVGTYATSKIILPTGDTSFRGGNRRTDFDNSTYRNPNTITNGTITSNWYLGVDVAVSGDGNIIVFTGGKEALNSYIYNRTTGAFCLIPKLNPTRKSRVHTSINYNGTLIALGYPTTDDVVYGAYEIRQYNIATNTTTRLYSSSPSSGTTRGMGFQVRLNGDGTILALTSIESSTSGEIAIVSTTDNWTNATTTLVTTTLDGFGLALSMNNAGTLIAVGARNEDTNVGRVYFVDYAKSTNTATLRLSGANPYYIVPDTLTGAMEFGVSVALSYDGNTLHIGANKYNSNRGAVQTFFASGSTFVFKTQTLGNTTPLATQNYGYSVATSQDGLMYIVGARGDTSAGTPPGYIDVRRINIATSQTLPSSLINTSSIANVSWIPDNTTLTPPSFAELNGTNTAIFPYYYCHSYSNFVDVVNVAIKEAFVANFNKIWTEWVSTLSVAGGTANAELIKAEYINIVARCFSTPPYMEWNSTLDATLYLNTLFSSVGNYYIPSRTFAINGQTQVSTNGAVQPLNLKLAFNASLYALFGGFPATETIIDGEKFYKINMPQQVALLRDNSTIPLRALPLIPDYPFLYDYHNITTGVFSIPYPTNSTATYPLQDYFIQLKQEISTIDAWCPISSIVFTSNQLPIIVSQFSSSNSVGNTRNSAQIGNRFALVITDLMTNQQGFRPNVIYNPTAEYRRISLTGNMGIRNIDINVFWRSKSGNLLPFRLPSGGSATLKLLFEKKNRNQDRVKEAEVVDILGGRMPSYLDSKTYMDGGRMPKKR